MTLAGDVVAELTRRRLTIGVAESLTGGLLIAELIAVPGASAVVLGGVVAYQTELKHTLLGVDARLLADRGPVDPDVAEAMAAGVRGVVETGGTPTDIGLATTGVAGPGPQGGHDPGVVFVGVAWGDETRVVALDLTGDREAIRRGTVSESLTALHSWLVDARE
ncbi:CinA family protein [Frigoribacterium sp. CFBP 13712]|uniref:CinA family protein n=1 Tax=Frigoribacterium sp. CFBP 13712 TaxID=2775309 RepID=UPI00177FA497|nr:nicotinamide-nucleotide amidohydrolase family protein [Frigoribacterium sp. CFBP 13712]MBD8703295.1 nicotinamide-nucleotide amidohydrolase family protein [Frigoribacterium sp. CFBP 13712]